MNTSVDGKSRTYPQKYILCCVVWAGETSMESKVMRQAVLHHSSAKLSSSDLRQTVGLHQESLAQPFVLTVLCIMKINVAATNFGEDGEEQ